MTQHVQTYERHNILYKSHIEVQMLPELFTFVFEQLLPIYCSEKQNVYTSEQNLKHKT